MSALDRRTADPNLVSGQSPRDATPRAVRGLTPPIVPARSALASPTPVADQFYRQRLTPRYWIIEGLEITVDEGNALLVDLSATGAQVLTAIPLRPNQRIGLVLVEDTRPVHLQGTVKWCSLELQESGPRYRAGVEFVDVNPDGTGRITRFCEANRRYTN